ncbi:MAG: hypothetical protein KatS3mg078_1945 [Deltaproteobacteria bacterium]|jgi:hypothetical protein|nr:hypothetical protein HRbin37_01687 [bacterium HR37]GIW48068.1 MAG: hypothetical protein KatS3mg078_1945 [Deltaproteobacteria bacterium]
MSKKTVTIEVFECDYVDENGVRCTNEGQRQAIKECAMCKKDLCSRHYEMISISSIGGRTSLTYFFCPEHAEEFINTLIKTFGDTRPVAYAGMAK